MRFKHWLSGIGIAIAGFFGYHAVKKPDIAPAPIVVVYPSPTPASSPAPGNLPKINIGTITGATDDEKVWIASANNMANIVEDSLCYKEMVLGSNYTETNGLTNQQIYDVFASSPVTIKVVIYNGTFADNHYYRTMGYENEPGTMYVNRYFMDGPKELASLEMHETAHSKGFTHYRVKATSVPYIQNDIWDYCSPKVGIE